MGRHYTVPVGADVEGVVRKFYVDGGGVPTAGLTVGFILRDASGIVVTAGDLVEVNGAVAPGWYKLPDPYSLDLGGVYTVEYSPPGGFDVDADTIFVTSPIGRMTTDYVRGG